MGVRERERDREREEERKDKKKESKAERKSAGDRGKRPNLQGGTRERMTKYKDGWTDLITDRNRETEKDREG